MKAATIHTYGGPDVFRIEDIAPPRLLPNDVLVEVRAAGINPVDCKIRSGVQRAFNRRTLPIVLGLDVSGIVVEVGARVTRFKRGDAVFGSPTHTRQGTYAELVAIDAAELAHKPTTIGHVEAASLPLVGQTAWQCLLDKARLRPGDKVFIQAGAGGVGTFAIQLAKHHGAEVATTCSESNAALVKQLGADVVVDYRRERFEELLRDYDVVLESIGGPDMQRARQVLRRGGRLVYVTSGLVERTARYGAYFGAAVVASDMFRFAVSSRLVGKHGAFVVRTPNANQLERIATLVDGGVIRPIVDKTFPLDRVADAHRALETGRTRGKIVLDLVAS